MTLRKTIRRLVRLLVLLFRLLIILAATTLVVLGLARLAVEVFAASRIHSPKTSPGARAAVVFGAGLYRDGTATPVLRDRVAAATELYFSGKVEKILMSGDNRFIYYNEPEAMRQFALSLGVPDSAIVLDYAGRRTYDTCYRATAIFGLREAVLVTQRFHLSRAVFTCNLLGLPATGVTADRRDYRRTSRLIWNLREIPASFVALWEVLVTRPKPVLGDPEPIFPNETTAIPPTGGTAP
jgi:SanA protein